MSNPKRIQIHFNKRQRRLPKHLHKLRLNKPNVPKLDPRHEASTSILVNKIPINLLKIHLFITIRLETKKIINLLLNLVQRKIIYHNFLLIKARFKQDKKRDRYCNKISYDYNKNGRL